MVTKPDNESAAMTPPHSWIDVEGVLVGLFEIATSCPKRRPAGEVLCYIVNDLINTFHLSRDEKRFKDAVQALVAFNEVLDRNEEWRAINLILGYVLNDLQRMIETKGGTGMSEFAKVEFLRTDGTRDEWNVVKDALMRWIETMLNARVLDTVNLRDGRVMLLDDLGHQKELAVNEAATKLYWSICKPETTHQIRGDVAITLDANFDEDEDPEDVWAEDLR